MILELEQFTQRLDSLRSTLKEVGEGLHIEDMERELQELHEEMNADGFWDNLERSTHVNRRIANLEGRIKHYDSLLSGCDDVETMMELAQEENDESMTEEISSELERLEKETEALSLETIVRSLTLRLESVILIAVLLRSSVALRIISAIGWIVVIIAGIVIKVLITAEVSVTAAVIISVTAAVIIPVTAAKTAVTAVHTSCFNAWTAVKSIGIKTKHYYENRAQKHKSQTIRCTFIKHTRKLKIYYINKYNVYIRNKCDQK